MKINSSQYCILMLSSFWSQEESEPVQTGSVAIFNLQYEVSFHFDIKRSGAIGISNWMTSNTYKDWFLKMGRLNFTWTNNCKFPYE